MPGQLNAQQIVTLTRDYLKEKGAEPYADGFVPTSSGLISILGIVNQCIGVFDRVGLTAQTFTQTLSSGTRDYPIDITAGDVLDSWVSTSSGTIRTIRNTTIPLLNSRIRGWRNPADPAYAPTDPRLYYINGRQFGLYPMPLASGLSLNYRASITSPDLVNPGDVPSGVPAQYHGSIPILSAAWISVSDIEADANQARAQYFFKRFDEEYPELKSLIDARSMLDIAPSGTPKGQDGNR